MSCTVYSSRILNELVQDAQKEPSKTSYGVGDASSAGRTPSMLNKGMGYPKRSFHTIKSESHRPIKKEPNKRMIKQQLAKRIMRNEAYWSEQGKMQAESERKVKEKLERQSLEKEIRFSNLLSSLETGHKVQAEIDEVLGLQEQRERRKQEARYQEWHDKVYQPIQDRIQKELDERDFQETISMKRREYEKFLETTNQKASLFLDIIIESDYDPFVPNKKSIKFNLGPVNDPLKRVLTKAQEERDMVPQVSNKLNEKEKRGILDVKMWGSGKVESTPHGHFAKMMSSDPRASKKVNLYKTNFKIDHFNIPTGTEVVNKEFPKGKRTNFEAHGIHISR